jgi:hypothetical protein
MKTLHSLTLAILLALASFATAQSAEWIAKKTGNSLKLTRELLAAGWVYDPSDNTITTPNGLGEPIRKHARRPHYAINIYRVVEQNGEIHAFVSYLCRYNPATHRTSWQLENGKWVEP